MSAGVCGSARPEDEVDPDAIERMVRVALEAVAGPHAAAFRVRRDGDLTVLADEQHGFGVGPEQLWVLESEPDAMLERVIDMTTDELTETRVLWAKRLPLCPVHPDAHPLVLEVRPDRVVGICPVSGPVRSTLR